MESDYLMDLTQSSVEGECSRGKQLNTPKTRQLQSQLNFQPNKTEQQTTDNWTEMLSLLDYVCSQIADRYELFSKGQPRRAMILEVLAKNDCLGCISKELHPKSFQRIDSIYSELHRLATSLLIEALHSQLVKNGHKVTIAAEASIRYGTADILIIPSNHGISIQSSKLEIVVEIKTGFSLSIPQLLRYLIDNNRRLLILWRIRNQQILFLDAKEIEQLLMQFVKMIIDRGERLLEAPELGCNHFTESKSWSPNSQQLQETFADFSKGIMKTLPTVIEKVVTKLEQEVN
jgi:RNA polymerase subunit RPABC4/transcription elongation factor Spt4